MNDDRFKGVIGGMLSIRKKVECGEVSEGKEADALATSTVVAALQK